MDTYMNKSIASGRCIAIPFCLFLKQTIGLTTLRPGVALPCRFCLFPRTKNVGGLGDGGSIQEICKKQRKKTERTGSVAKSGKTVIWVEIGGNWACPGVQHGPHKSFL